MATALTKLLGIDVPVLQGGMAWISDGRLAAAVSNAGGAGVIAAGGREADWLRGQIRLARELTVRPFGVNVAILSPNRDEVVDVILEEKVSFAMFGGGDPLPYFARLSMGGVKLIPVVPNIRLARRVEDAGADAVVLEGTEAGGHIGVLTTMALLTQAVPLLSIPAVAAGGIIDGRGLAAALVMGAAGVQMGTAFLLAEECAAHPRFKQALIEATDTDTVVTGASIGHRVRGLRSAFTDRFLELERQCTPPAELERLAAGTNKLAAVDGDIVNGMVMVGQSVHQLKKVEPASDIIGRVMSEARAALSTAPHLL